MLRVIPSLSIYKGRTAKVSHGDFQNAQLFDKSPVDLAKYFEDNGAEWLQFVDLDGAGDGTVRNDHILQVIASYSKLKVNFSGGVRTSDDVSAALKSGAKTVTVSTVAAQKPDLFMEWIISFGANRLVLGADVSNGKIVTGGWKAETKLDPWEHIQYFYDRSVQFLKLTDVDRDGVLEGPNFELYKEARDRFPNLNIVASGGVRSIADIEKLDELGIWGVIVARALL